MDFCSTGVNNLPDKVGPKTHLSFYKRKETINLLLKINNEYDVDKNNNMTTYISNL